MRKFFYSFCILGTFALYALHQQSEASTPAVLPPAVSQTLPPSSSATSQQPPAPVPPSLTPSSKKTTPQAAQKQPPAPPVVSQSPPPQPKGQYTDGQYTGPVADAYYGTIQVRATISGGKLTDVTFLQYPNYNSTCIYINSQAMPYLRQEAIQAQSANVDIVSGATDSSTAFRQSLAGALAQAKS